jgi:predicted enzyme related to lactoylglutathione lyase
MSQTTVNVRYMVDDVETAVEWYTSIWAFRFCPTRFSRSQTSRVDLCGVRSADRQARRAGRCLMASDPKPAGCRFHLVVDDLPAEVARLRAAGLQFRNDIVIGPGGSQILLLDPSGNLVELFQPARC